MVAAKSALDTRGGREARWAPLVRWIGGAVFAGFGIGKFSDHAHEASSFDSYGLPAPDAFAYLIGGLEIAAGALLLAGLLTRLAALAMVGNMIGAIVVSGFGQGEVVPSLTVAPALLLAMLFLLWVGPGRFAADSRLLQRGAGDGTPIT